MQTKSHQLFRTAGLLTATSLVITASQLVAADNTDAFPSFDSYIKISGQSASIKGDGAALQKRTGQNENYGVGIEEFYYGRDLTKSTAMTIQGRALGGTEDYLLHINVAKSELGSIDVGYESFRTFYDCVGGFFPGGVKWRPVTSFYPTIDQDMSVDRGKLWAEVKLAKENLPEITLRYTNETRSGLKDSTIWGETNNTGINYTNTPAGVTGVISNAAQRKFLPSYIDIEERHQSLVSTVKHTFGKTTAQLSVTGDWSSIDNGRFTMKYPGEAQLVKVVAGPNNDTLVTPSGGAVLASNWATFGSQTEQSTFDVQDAKTYGIAGTTLTAVTDRLTLRVGAGYQNVTDDFGGRRLTIASTPNGPDYGLNTVTNYFDFNNLDGRSQVDALTGNVGVDFAVTRTLTASLSVRGEDRSANSDASYDKKSKPRSGSLVVPVTSLKEASTADEQSLTPVVDVRYNGIKDLALYSTASRKFGTGSEVITAPYNPTALAAASGEQVFYNDITEARTEYLIGANWKASSFLTLRGEPFMKNNVYHVKGYNRNVRPASVLGDATNNNYELESQFYGAKFTAIAKPLNTLSFTTRYIYQRGDGQVSGYLPTTPQYDSMESTTHTIGETIDWNPTTQFYMQASASVVFNVISTAYQHKQATAAANAIPGNLVLQNSDNNYTTLSFLAGLVVTKSDDVQLQFTAYRADNYSTDLALYTQPYGAGATESTVSLGLKHKFSDKLIGNAKIGYTDSHNDTTGGNTDYHGVLAYVSLAYAL